MAKRDLPNIGDRLFLMNKEIVVTGVHKCFQLVKIRYLEDVSEFTIDISALSNMPDLSNALSLGFLGRE